MITGNQKVKALYEKWVDRLGYRDHKLTKKSIMGAPRTNYDDTDHLLGDLYLLNLIEEDAELLKFYRKCVQDSWQVHKDDKMAWFNFIYHAVLGDEYGNLQGSLWNLQTFPTCRIFQPQMNSIRTDLAFYTNGGVLESLHPLPVYHRPSDNEYTWKQSPYKLDGWLSRIVHVVEISPHDPYVQLAADTSGQAYYSNTKGQIWHGLPALEDVHDFLFSTSYPWIIFAATQSGIYRSIDGTMNWEKVLDRPTYRLYLDTENDHVLYAVVQGAIYQSDDFGEQAMGTIWRSVSGPEVVGANPFFDIDPQGPKATVYMLTPEGLYWKKEDQTKWNNPPHHMRTYGFGKVNRIGGKPLQLRVSSGPTKRIFRSVELSVRNRKLPFVTFSEDRGQTWKPVLRELEPMVNWYTGTDKTVKTEGFDYRKAFDMLKQFPIKDLWVDPDEPDRWYGLMDTGIAVTNDAGKTWTQSSKGLDIPRTYAMWIPRHTTDIYVGTPAGLYVSQDRGVSWQQTPLILQSDANPHGQKEQAAVRAEIGGIGYLEAYWMGLYHGFITDEQAGARWWEN